jgi:hypothetical protein
MRRIEPVATVWALRLPIKIIPKLAVLRGILVSLAVTSPPNQPFKTTGTVPTVPWVLTTKT